MTWKGRCHSEKIRIEAEIRSLGEPRIPADGGRPFPKVKSVSV